MEQLLFLLVRSQLHNTPIPEETKEIVKENIEALYALAAPQGLAPILGQALSDNGLLTQNQLGQKIRSYTMQAFSRQAKQDFEFARICECLDQAQICYVPLKGAVVRKFYPEGWMRTSSDIDILVKETDLNAAVKTVMEKLDYTQPANREYHDISLFSPNGVHLELHFSLKENHEKLDKGLSRVWDYTVPAGENTCRQDLTPAFFVYHIVAHCAYHFMSSGCGGKAVLDLWLLKHKMGYDEAEVEALCALSGLECFYENIMALSEVWFSGKESTPFLSNLGKYILDAGFGGSRENAVAAGILKKGGKGNFVISRLFLPYDMLKEYYPVLNCHKWLMPVCQVRRWFAGLKRRSAGDMMGELKTGTQIDKNKLTQTEKLFSELKLI